MLDELSNRPPPSNIIIINELYELFIKEEKYKNLNKKLISSEINKFINAYPRDKLGSLSGYYIFFKEKIIIEINKILSNIDITK